MLDAADTIVWLDLPMRVWLPAPVPPHRAPHRGPRGALQRQPGVAGETAFWGRDSLFVYALRSHSARRRDWPARLAGYPVARLRTPAEVERWLRNA